MENGRQITKLPPQPLVVPLNRVLAKVDPASDAHYPIIIQAVSRKHEQAGQSKSELNKGSSIYKVGERSSVAVTSHRLDLTVITSCLVLARSQQTIDESRK